MLDARTGRDRPLVNLPDLTLGAAVSGPLVFLVSWSLSGALQPAGYDAVRQSISALAVASAAHPWIVTAGLYVIGTCQVLTAAGLTQMRRVPRLFLAFGGLASFGVAWFPQPESGPTDLSAHIVFATLCIVSLAVWPWLVHVRGFGTLRPVSGRVAGAATTAFLLLLGWVYVAGHGMGALGMAERVEITVASLWPLVIVLALRRAGTAVLP